MTSPRALEVRSFGVRIGSRWILRDVGFEARAGEVTAVLGPNGAGKTTLLEGVAGLRPHVGSVSFDGRPLHRFADLATTFAFLPDVGVLPPEATVRTLVEHASSRASRDVGSRALCEGLAIDPLLSKAVGTLSRGEHQRVALACTLVLGRPVVMLDEPFAAFDPVQLRSVLAVVRDVARESAIVASIHQLADAERVADRFLLLADGQGLAFGDRAALRSKARVEAASLEEIFVALLEGPGRAS